MMTALTAKRFIKIGFICRTVCDFNHRKVDRGRRSAQNILFIPLIVYLYLNLSTIHLNYFRSNNFLYGTIRCKISPLVRVELKKKLLLIRRELRLFDFLSLIDDKRLLFNVRSETGYNVVVDLLGNNSPTYGTRIIIRSCENRSDMSFSL